MAKKLTYELVRRLYKGSDANKLVTHQTTIMNNNGDSCLSDA